MTRSSVGSRDPFDLSGGGEMSSSDPQSLGIDSVTAPVGSFPLLVAEEVALRPSRSAPG